MSFEAWITFAVLNFAYSPAPGPNAALIVGAGARRGIKAGGPILIGILIAEVFWALIARAIFVGFLDLARLRPETLKMLGSVSLVLIGGSMLLVKAPLDTGCSERILVPLRFTGARQMICKDGIVGHTNPLALVFFVSIAPRFLSGDAVSLKTAGLFTLAAVLSCAAAACCASSAPQQEQARSTECFRRVLPHAPWSICHPVGG